MNIAVVKLLICDNVDNCTDYLYLVYIVHKFSMS